MRSDGEIHGRTDAVEIAKLQAKERELSDFIENATIGIHCVDSNGVIKWANTHELRMLGYSQGEYVGKPITQFHADQVVIDKILARLCNNEELHNTPARLICKDGSVKNVLINSNVYWENGKFIHTRCFTRDVSDLINIETTLAERIKLADLRVDIAYTLANESDFVSALQKCAKSMVSHLDVAFARIWTLNATQTVLELKASAGMYVHLDGPHSRVKVGDFKIGRIAANRKPHLSNSVPTDPEVGDKKWAIREGMKSFAGYPLIVRDQLVGVLAMFSRHEMSQTILEELQLISSSLTQWIIRKEAEAQLIKQKEWLQVTLQSIGDAVITTDVSGNVTYLNPVAETLCGWPLEEARGTYISRVFNVRNERTQIAENAVEKVVSSGSRVALCPHTTLISKKNEVLPIEASGAPIKDSAGSTIGVVLVFHDNFERSNKDKQQALLIENASLYRVRASRAKREMEDVLASVSEGIIRLRTDFAIEYANDKATILLGKTATELVGTNIWSIFSPKVKLEFTKTYSPLLKEMITISMDALTEDSSAIELIVHPLESGAFILFIKNK